MLLYWSAMQRAIATGHQVFDFGRSSVDSSTLRFKQQWGTSLHPLPWYYDSADNMPDVSNSNTKFEMAVKIWQKLPVSLANLLGPPITKHLP